MEPIPVYRAAHLFSYLNLLRKIGAPVERGLRQAKLPTNLGHQPESQVPLLPTLNFLTNMSHNEGVDDLALRARAHFKIEELSPMFLNSIFSAATLKGALEAFFRTACKENTTLSVWMAAIKSSVRLCNLHRVPYDPLGTRHLEYNTIMSTVAIVRFFAGSKWSPKEIGFQSKYPLGKYAEEQFPNTRIRLGESCAWITLPVSMLSLPLRMKQNTGGSESASTAVANQVMNFPFSLKLALQSYLGDGYPTIELAAEIANTSVRTLQRKLKQFNLSYSELVHQVQYESAVELLKDPGTRTVDIAYAVGYEDPSNFARAFRRISGVSPKEFRKLNCLQS